MPLLLLHFIATAYMAGLIWFVQLVHYPLMAAVGRAGFAAYERSHQRRTSWAVGPAMLVEMLTAIALLVIEPGVLTLLGFSMLLIIWLSTAFVQVPAHRRLEAGFEATAHRQLVTTNWIRTVLWSARTVIAAMMLLSPESQVH